MYSCSDRKRSASGIDLTLGWTGLIPFVGVRHHGSVPRVYESQLVRRYESEKVKAKAAAAAGFGG